MMDIFDTMIGRHEEVMLRVERLRDAVGSCERRQLRDSLCRIIRRAVEIEESVLYPAFRRHLRTREDLDMFLQGLQEHCGVAEISLAELESADVCCDRFPELVKSFGDRLSAHHTFEAGRLFPRARYLMACGHLDDSSSGDGRVRFSPERRVA